ncbi:MAG: amidase [Trueperaceae bacterium]|nr:amidase [Trueperaceae bacterium]
MRTDPEVAFLPAFEQHQRMLTGALTPTELVATYLERIDGFNPRLNAYINVDRAGAMERASELEGELRRGTVRSVLHGTVFAVKDQMRLRTLPTTGGSRVRAPLGDRQATVVSRLEEAGAILLGTLNTHEFHHGPTRVFPFGRPVNPWNVNHSTGGSSSGSALAVAAGLCSFSLGGDTGGSIRAPASHCGVAGLKPTWSRVSRAGVIPLSASLDCVGPLGRSVRDAAHVLEVVAGRDPSDSTSSSKPVPTWSDIASKADLRGVRIGLVEELMVPDMTSEAVVATTQRAIEVLTELGAVVVPCSIPTLSDTRFISPALVASETVEYHREALRTSYADFDENTRISMVVGALLPASLVTLAERLRANLAIQVSQALEQVDLLVGPTAGNTAPELRDPPLIESAEVARTALFGVGRASGQHTRAYSFAGIPALSIPSGFDGSGLPVGLQLAAKHFGESQILSAAYAFERATDWHGRVPTGLSAG